MNTLFRGMIAAVLLTNVALYCMEKGSGASEAVIFPGTGSSVLDLSVLTPSSSPQNSPLVTPGSSPTDSPRLVGHLDVDPEWFLAVAQRALAQEVAKNSVQHDKD